MTRIIKKQKDQLIKNNFIHVVTALAEQDAIDLFISAIDIDKKTFNKLRQPTSNYIPSDNCIKKIELYLEREWGFEENTFLLSDKELLQKLCQKELISKMPLRNSTYFQSNLAMLLDFYNEPQSHLAMSVGLTPPAINNYLNQKGRLPDIDHLLAIAKHFHITIEQLLYQKMTYDSLRNFPINDEVCVKTTWDSLLPVIIHPEDIPESQRNEKFVKAVEIHESLREFVYNGSMHEHIQEVEELMRLYKEASNEGCPKALINHLWWLMYFGIGIFCMTDSFLKNKKQVLKKDARVSDAYNLGLLDHPLKVQNLYEFSIVDLKAVFMRDYNEMIIYDLHTIKRLGEHDIADYYAALRYEYGMVHTPYEPETNRIIGQEMNNSLFMTGNPYVIKFYETHNELLARMKSSNSEEDEE